MLCMLYKPMCVRRSPNHVFVQHIGMQLSGCLSCVFPLIRDVKEMEAHKRKD